MAQKKLVPDKIRYENGLKICEKIIPWGAKWQHDYYVTVTNEETGEKKSVLKYKTGAQYKADRKLNHGSGIPAGTTAHNTGGGADAETYTRATWPNCNMGTVRVHFYVDHKEAWQNLRLDEMGWHAANSIGNDQTLSVEIIMSGKTGAENLRAEKNGAVLLAILMVKFNLPISTLHSHHYWYKKKDCPVYIRPHWQAFVDRVKGYMDQIRKDPDVNLFPEDIVKEDEPPKAVPVPVPTPVPVVAKPPVTSGGCCSSAAKPSGCSTSAPKCGSACGEDNINPTYQNAYMPGGSMGSSCTPCSPKPACAAQAVASTPVKKVAPQPVQKLTTQEKKI